MYSEAPADKPELQTVTAKSVSQRNMALQPRDASGFRQSQQKQIVGSGTQRPQSNLQAG